MELTQLHLKNIAELLSRRQKFLSRLIFSRFQLSRLDYKLLVSLMASRDDCRNKLDDPSSLDDIQLFLQLFHGFIDHPDMTINHLDTHFDALVEQQQIIASAMQLAKIKIDQTVQKPQHPELQLLLARFAYQFDLKTLHFWVDASSPELIANLLHRLIYEHQQQDDSWLKPHANSSHPSIRCNALQLLAIQNNQGAIAQLLEEPHEMFESGLTAKAILAWFHPEYCMNHEPEFLALTGKPESIPRLFELMQSPQNHSAAYQGWLYITGRTLPHYPEVRDIEVEAQHVAPTATSYPDIKVASKWWRKQSWNNDNRYFLGQPINPSGINYLAQTYVGQCLSVLGLYQRLHSLPAQASLAGFCLPGGVE